ncbi:hypothetical protein D3C75_772120 [compost metagenome]
MQFICAALQQHLCNDSRTAEIPVDDKDIALRSGNARFGVGEQIIEAQAADKVGDMLIGLLPVMQPGKAKPEQSRCELHILQFILEHPVLQRHSGCTAELRRPAGSDSIAGIQREHMRQVPMLRLGFLIVLQPFLELPFLADLKRRKLGYGCPQHPLERFVPVQQFRRHQAEFEQLPDKNLIHSRSHGQLLRPLTGITGVEAVLRRVGRAGNQPAVFGMDTHVIQVEGRCLLEYRIGLLLQEFMVKGVFIMPDQMGSEP